jgi:hypothetical protein
MVSALIRDFAERAHFESQKARVKSFNARQISTGWKVTVVLACLIVAFIFWMVFVADAP